MTAGPAPGGNPGWLDASRHLNTKQFKTVQPTVTPDPKNMTLAARSSSIQERISKGEDHWSYHV